MFFRAVRGFGVADARSVGRRAGVVVVALFSAGVPLVVAPALPVASATDCADAEVIFARGTDEPAGMGRVGDALVDALRKQTDGLNVSSYAVNYKAGKLQLHGGDGANDVINHIKSTVSSCPDTKIILGGYSQGASVIDIVAGVPMGGITWGSSLPPEYAKNIAAVATFGDVADRTGGSLPAQSTLLGSKAIDFCNPADPICHAGPGNEWSGHTEGYVPFYTDQAAAFAAAKLLAGYSQHMPDYGPPPGYDSAATGYGPATSNFDPTSSVHGPSPGYGPELPGPSPGPSTTGTGSDSTSPGYAPASTSSGYPLAAEVH
ncbi:cutinase family protein [Mycolicibacterium sphagni]|nr:cutinase family protein [Mycolicibacterium sphagni]